MMRVALVEDQGEIREGLRALIGGTPGFQVCGSWGSMEAALPQILRCVPDVVLIDLGLPGMSGIDGTQTLRERFPKLPILVLTIHRDDQRVFDAICAGASGYLLKSTPPDRLIEGIREVIAGGSPMSPEIARKVIERFQMLGMRHSPEIKLTHQEIRLLQLLVQGHSYKTAAADMGVTMHTVSFHLRKIYVKLQVHSKSAAVAKALTGRLL
ncbi:MAG TPA: response regulator transcription factor [Candidatus Acidoferrales bacterium]|nr:response regulator transcription factor [Candidatus Acidoferrales bacterium]